MFFFQKSLWRKSLGYWESPAIHLKNKLIGCHQIWRDDVFGVNTDFITTQHEVIYNW